MAEQHTAPGAREYDVLLRLCVTQPMSDDELATLAETIYEAVGTYAKSCVDGPAIGYKLSPREIHLDFTTEAESLSEVERVIERVNDIIVGETDMTFELARLCDAAAA